MAHLAVWLVLTSIIGHCLAAATACGPIAVVSTPTHLICGGLGELRSPSPLEPAFIVRNEIACADECEITEGCVSFGYNATTQTSCQLYKRAIVRQKHRHRRQDLGAKYSNRHCFKCTSVCNIRNPIYSSLQAKKPDIATAFCSSYLGYPSLTTTIIPTTTTAIETSVTTLPDSTTTTSTTTTTTSTTTSFSTSTTTTTLTSVSPTTTTTTTYTYNAPAKIKRDHSAESTSAACSCFVDPSTSTVTTTDINTTSTTTTTTTSPTSTVTSTEITTSLTTTTTVSISTSTTLTATTTTEVIVSVTPKPAICNAAGLPGQNAFNYDANFNSSPAACIASCKSDARCFCTGGYVVTDPSTGSQTYTCRSYDKPVADTADLGFGYYTFNDKACP